ncbi:MAG: adenosylcobinamide-GDP ribazoletransferase [Spirochaetes bacterium]|nr:adenosylcobinamide-GDP ribazoletransferase [Spirochaetota bacterium]
MANFFKTCLKGFYMSLGLFCAIPLPARIWDDSCKHLVLPCLPLAGILIGAIWWGAAELLVLSGVHLFLTAAAVAVSPFLLTGFLHLDGYMDTSDAILSRRPLEEKLRILKDPHAGAFAVIALVILAIMQFAALYAIVDGEKNLAMLAFIAVISRCCSSLALFCLKIMPQSGFAAMLRQNTKTMHKIFVIMLAVSAGTAAFLYAGLHALAVLLCVIAGFAGALACSYREFKGVSGDLTGHSLVLGELCGLIALAVI